MPILSMLKAAFFDLDGLLADTERYQWEGWNEVLKIQGIEIGKGEYIQKYAGKNGILIAEGIVKDKGLDDNPEELLSKKENVLMKWFRGREIRLMHYAREGMELFIKKGIRVAVISSSPRDELELKMKRLGIDSIPEFMVSRDDVEKGKPNPDIYLRGLEKFGLKAVECIAFEDTQSGVESASSAGISCIAVPSEFSREQDFSRAEGVFQNLEEALGWVKDRYF
jgi:HAD superfamily hydrolase (TIGR01509 family)